MQLQTYSFCFHVVISEFFFYKMEHWVWNQLLAVHSQKFKGNFWWGKHKCSWCPTKIVQTVVKDLCLEEAFFLGFVGISGLLLDCAALSVACISVRGTKVLFYQCSCADVERERGVWVSAGGGCWAAAGTLEQWRGLALRRVLGGDRLGGISPWGVQMQWDWPHVIP